VIQENTKRDGDIVEVEKASPKNRHIRVKGLDFRAGDDVLPAGHRLTARDLALAAGMNHPLVAVHRRPKVVLFATGDELVQAGSEPAPGQIVSSNNYAIGALARSEDATVEDFGIVGDRLDDTIAAVRRARDSGADILVTSGGASVGDYDLVQKAFISEGMALAFWRLALRPGRPLMNGRLGGMHVLGVPGNPVSALVCGFLFLVPLIRRLAGRRDLTHEIESAKLGVELPENDERADYLRATLARGPDGLVATPFPVQDSSMMLLLAKADCLIVREPYEAAAKIGDICRIVKFER